MTDTTKEVPLEPKLRITELLLDEGWHDLTVSEQDHRRREAARAIEACFAANDDLLKRRAAAPSIAGKPHRELVERLNKQLAEFERFHGKGGEFWDGYRSAIKKAKKIVSAAALDSAGKTHKELVNYVRAPEYDKRIAKGDDFAGDAYVRWVAVDHHPNEASIPELRLLTALRVARKERDSAAESAMDACNLYARTLKRAEAAEASLRRIAEWAKETRSDYAMAALVEISNIASLRAALSAKPKE